LLNDKAFIYKFVLKRKKERYYKKRDV